MRRYLVAVAILGLLVWSAAGWRGPALTVPGAPGSGEVGYYGVIGSMAESRTFGVVGLCLTAGRAATVIEVTLVDAHGLTVTDFGTARIGPSGPDVPGVLAETPSRIGYTREPVTQRCEEPGTVALAYSARVSDPAAATAARADGVAVHYLLDGTPGVLTVPTRVTLCVLPVARADECDARHETDSEA